MTKSPIKIVVLYKYNLTAFDDISLNNLWRSFAVNPLLPGVVFLYPLKTSENLKILWYFQGV